MQDWSVAFRRWFSYAGFLWIWPSKRIKRLCNCMWHCWNEDQHFQNWSTASFEKSCPRFSSSWLCIAEAGVELNYKYPRDTFTSNEMQDEELDVQLGTATAVMRALLHLVVLKRELSRRTKLSVLKSIFVPILTYGHQPSITAERVRSQVQVSEVICFRKIKGVTVVDKLRNSTIQESLNIDLLLLQIERPQFKWFGHVSRMPQEGLSKQTLWWEEASWTATNKMAWL